LRLCTDDDDDDGDAAAELCTTLWHYKAVSVSWLIVNATKPWVSWHPRFCSSVFVVATTSFCVCISAFLAHIIIFIIENCTKGT